jgi:hypothetical protein
MKKAGFLEEQDGSRSMRRALALLYSLCSAGCFGAAAINGEMTGVWAGIAAMLGVLVLAGYTTLESVKSLITCVKGRGCGKED